MKRMSQTRRNFLRMTGIATTSFAFPGKIYPALCTEPQSTGDKFPISAQFRLYSGLLRLYDEFDPLPDRLAPSFQYECAHPELERLREKYRLDRVAGTGDDWSKARNLMRWITGHVKHRGDITSALPEVCKSLPMNALGLLEYSFEKGQDHGINCYMLAIVLTEICLSLRLKSRIVSLNPMNPYDYDNHLVTVVWCSNFSKWVMVDPSYNAYLSDAEGEVLNPWEVRDLLCRHKLIVCNDELAHNGASYSSEDYLRYMAKNLFYMHSPTFSGFNSTTTSEKPWLTLTPKHFDVCKREAYNMKWRMDGDNGNWEYDELEKLMREECFLVCTSSISSFSKTPA
jgi:hypothetical protein